jgi:hypothetical protein
MIGEILYIAHRLRRPLILGVFAGLYCGAALVTQAFIGR